MDLSHDGRHEEGAHGSEHDPAATGATEASHGGAAPSMMGSLAGRVGAGALQRRIAQRSAARQAEADRKSLGGDEGGDEVTDDKTGSSGDSDSSSGAQVSAKPSGGADTGGGSGDGASGKGGSSDEAQGDQKAPKVPVAATASFDTTTIRGTTTPAGMPDRIAPHKDFKVGVTVSGVDKGAAPVTVEVKGSGSGAGTVNVEGGASVDLKKSKSLHLKGKAQTAPGSGGGLTLVARQGATVLAQSDPFSVSAIPQNYKDTFVSLLTGAKRGFVVQDDWQSDSGQFSELDETEISEQVEVTSATGCFSGTGKSNSGYLPGNEKSKDTHSSPASIMTSAGTRDATQTCMFKDKRTGATDIPMTRSGYSLTRVVAAAKGGKFKFTMTKQGASVTANGVTSGAGAGYISKTQDV